MVVPVIQEPVKNKELLIEVDSIVTDNKDLANVSLSSNDSLSKSRRKWRLIRIINKLNPALAERKYKFPTLKFFFALFLIILTSMIIYWSLSPHAVVNSKPDCPSSIALKSSPKYEPSAQVSPREYVPPTVSKLLPLKSKQFLPYVPPKMKEDAKIETSDQVPVPWAVLPRFEEPDYEATPLIEDMFFDYPGMEDGSYYPDTENFMFKFPDSFNDLSDTFSLRSSDVNSDLVLASVDKFINFFKSMINF